MGHMQAGMMLLSQFYGQKRTLITSLLTTDLRMMDHFRIFAVFLLSLSHVAIDDIRILAMRHDGQMR